MCFCVVYLYLYTYVYTIYIHIHIYIHKHISMIARLIRIGWSYLKCSRYGSGKFQFGIYPKYIQICQRYTEIYQNIPRYTEYQTAAGPPRLARPRRHGPDRDRRRGRAGRGLFNIFWYIPKLNFLEFYGSIFQIIGQGHIHLYEMIGGVQA